MKKHAYRNARSADEARTFLPQIAKENTLKTETQKLVCGMRSNASRLHLHTSKTPSKRDY